LVAARSRIGQITLGRLAPILLMLWRKSSELGSKGLELAGLLRMFIVGENINGRAL